MTSVVTGARGAIGSAVVQLLTASGEHVIACDLRAAPAVDMLEAVEWITGSLWEDAVQGMLRRALGSRPLNCVIAAHGVDGAGSLDELTPQFARNVFDVNFSTVVTLLDLTAPALQAGHGRFVAISSQAGLIGEADNAAYCAAKFALLGWATQLAPAVRQRGMSMHVLCPGCTESPLLYGAQERFARSRGAYDDAGVQSFIAQRAAHIPVGRFATPKETAASAVYLATGPGQRPTVLAETGGEVTW
jgi:NAD(P)-dependent dehydrogenase (short-subunit alcohol dehydrogenase family)